MQIRRAFSELRPLIFSVIPNEVPAAVVTLLTNDDESWKLEPPERDERSTSLFCMIVVASITSLK